MNNTMWKHLLGGGVVMKSLSMTSCVFFMYSLLLQFSAVHFFFFCRVVEFATKEDMKNALKKLDDSELNGRRIRLKVVSPISHFSFSYLLYS